MGLLILSSGVSSLNGFRTVRGTRRVRHPIFILILVTYG